MRAALGERGAKHFLDVSQFLHAMSHLGESLLDDALDLAAAGWAKQRLDVVEGKARCLRCADETEAFQFTLRVDPVVRRAPPARLENSGPLVVPDGGRGNVGGLREIPDGELCRHPEGLVNIKPDYKVSMDPTPLTRGWTIHQRRL